jgi:chorismate dehydratase
VANTKISIVRYLNAAPLSWGILNGSPQSAAFQPVFSTPAECADQLAAATVDIGLIPSIEFHRIKGSRIIPGPAIACRQRVRSVLLVSQLPLWKVRTVAFDRGSRSSVILARIIFQEFYKNRPDFRPAEPDPGSMLAQSDAALIIGDIALKFMSENERPNAEHQKPLLRLSPEPLEVFDLVERWRFLTGLPFLFAFWAAREGFRDQSVVDTLKASRDSGVAHTGEIATSYAKQLGIAEDYVRDYLDHNVYYYMDESCIGGLRVFYEKAAQIGAVKSQRALEFL